MSRRSCAEARSRFLQAVQAVDEASVELRKGKEAASSRRARVRARSPLFFFFMYMESGSVVVHPPHVTLDLVVDQKSSGQRIVQPKNEKSQSVCDKV